ncbi:unnamed protein product [Rangifer tarandus platyrhynchus]|uniref:Transmembrane protein 225 domain-containing protein n=1 Tax=Rangifer tarandus platyrhynchus TaxID=3082113 RepID=A0ABN8Z0A7_RANTA|nr:unnamed protein product [Rangifer tarandus platyrhynchus]
MVRNILIVVLGLSFMHSLLLDFEFTYTIPQTKYTLIMTACFAFLTGFLSLLQYKQSINGSGSLITIRKSARESQVMEQHGVSIKVVSLPAGTAMPRSIVRVHSAHVKEDSPKRPHVQAHRVT